MELHYYKHIEEAEEYLTWEFVVINKYHYGDLIATIEEGWTKKSIPNFISSQEEEAKKWFHISNMEDTHFLEMESMYCEMYIQDTLKEIEIAEPHNVPNEG